MSNIANIPFSSSYTFSTPLEIAGSGSTYGIVFSNEMVGGYQEFPTISERDNIPVSNYIPGRSFSPSINEDLFSSGRRRVGMTAYILSNNTAYRLIPWGYYGNGGTLGGSDWASNFKFPTIF